jgi:IS5 family transposase
MPHAWRSPGKWCSDRKPKCPEAWPIHSRRYRGHNAPPEYKFKVFTAGQKRRVTPQIKRQMRRRAAVEPVIRHLKAGHRMGRNHLAHNAGDAINAVLAAAGLQLPPPHPVAEPLVAQNPERSRTAPQTSARMKSEGHGRRLCFILPIADDRGEGRHWNFPAQFGHWSASLEQMPGERGCLVPLDWQECRISWISGGIHILV